MNAISRMGWPGVSITAFRNFAFGANTPQYRCWYIRGGIRCHNRTVCVLVSYRESGPVGPVEDWHLRVSAPCRAHQKKSAAPKGCAFGTKYQNQTTGTWT